MRAGERRAVIAVGGTLAAQTAAALLWAGAAAERLEQLEARVDATSELTVRTARLEEQAEHIRDTLVRIEGKLDDVRGQR